MHIKELNHHKVLMVRGVGVHQAWSASHVYCGLVHKYSMVVVCIILEQENGRALTPNTRRPPCLIYQIVLYFPNDPR